MNQKHRPMFDPERNDFAPGGYLHYVRSPTGADGTTHQPHPSAKLHMSIFGEWVYIFDASPEQAICNLRLWIGDFFGSYDLDLKHFDNVQDEALKIVRSELAAEYLFANDRIAEFNALLARDPVARAHILSINSTNSNATKLALAQHMVRTMQAKLAAQDAIQESLQSQ